MNVKICPTEERILKLFQEFIAVYGEFPIINMGYPMQVLVETWKNRLSGITDEMVDRGFEKLCSPFSDHMRYPPNPTEFLLFCLPTPEELGIPSVYRAFQDYKNQDIESIKRTTNRIGERLMSKLSEELIWELWAEQYEIVVKEMLKENYEKLKEGII